MTVIDDLLSSIPADSVLVKEVLIGLYWTAVYGHRVGLAATPIDSTCCTTTDIDDVGRLHHCTLNALALRLQSNHPLEVTVGMAALNALLPVNEQNGTDINAREVLLAYGRERTVVTVGHFPFTEALRHVAARMWVLELNPLPGDHPSEAAPEIIPQADVIGLTATTLLNGTFESLSRLFPPKALVVMLGPSTPLSPVLFDYGVTMLGGTLVSDPDAVLRYIGQGSSLHCVPGLRRFTMMK